MSTRPTSVFRFPLPDGNTQLVEYDIDPAHKAIYAKVMREVPGAGPIDEPDGEYHYHRPLFENLGFDGWSKPRQPSHVAAINTLFAYLQDCP